MNILSSLIQPFTVTPSTTTDMTSVSTAKISTPVKAETPISQQRVATPMKTVVKETVSYQPRSFIARSGRTTQVPAKFKD